MNINVFVSADTHYRHKNIVLGESNWENKQACRKFSSVEEHDETLIENINKLIKPNDIFYLLGDVSFGGKESVYDFINRINCKNIHLILGNHDHHIRKNAIVNNIPLKSLFKSVNDLLYKRIFNENYVMCHYSLRTWENGHNGSIMLYGHSHGSLPDYKSEINTTYSSGNGKIIKKITKEVMFKTMDVGIDTHPEFRPYSIEEINYFMKDRIPLQIDHH